MFNRSAAFNRMPFNQPYFIDVLFSANLDGIGELTASLNLEFYMSGQLDGQGELIADIIREIFFSVQMDGIGELDGEIIRERILASSLNAYGSLQGNLSKFHVDSIEILGTFAPGEKITIDSKKLRAQKNGVPISYSGDFFDLYPGENVIAYTDEESGRTLQIRITHRDKFLY